MSGSSMNDNTLREQIGQVHSGKHPVSWMLEPEAIDEIMQLIAARDEQREREYSEIFKWLLGEADDFPQTQYRYGWRTELRKRLAPLNSKQQTGEK